MGFETVEENEEEYIEMKEIIELEHNPEKLLQECLVYMLSYKE